MTEETAKPSRSRKSSTSTAQQTYVAASQTAPDQDTSPPPNAEALIAANEHTLIFNALSAVSVPPQFLANSAVDCPEKPDWCLPDVNCTARVTMSLQAIDAFKANREACRPGHIVD